jgi:parallel beta-helix repeat protein
MKKNLLSLSFVQNEACLWRKNMKRRIALFSSDRTTFQPSHTSLLLLGAAALVLGSVGGAWSDATGGLQATLLKEAETALSNLVSLAAVLDPTMTDVAVTDDELATTGITLDTSPAMLSSPSMLIVDDDKVQCPNAQFTSINAAVLAAAPGDTILVCPGLYKESVAILLKAGLTLQAQKRAQCNTADDPTKEAIVLYNATLNGGFPSEGFDVESANVTIDGFKVEPDPTIVLHDGVAIFASPVFSGYDIRHNVVKNNTFGIYVNSNGSAPTYVRENCSLNNNLAGAASGNGVYSDQGLSNAQITNNYFTGDQNGAIIIDTFLTVPHDIAITHNESVNDGAIGTFASAGPAAYNLTVDYNKVIGSVGSGIVTTNVTQSEYAYNIVENGTFNGVSLHSTGTSVVRKNKAIGFQLSGIRIADSSNNNTVSNNRAVKNKQAGLAATLSSSGNTIQGNHMKGNTPDCYDDTTGGGTAGTANSWINDFGFTQNRPGLCKHSNDDEDEGEGEDRDHNHADFHDSPSDPGNSQMHYRDPSQNMSLQSVNGVGSISYNNTCVNFAGDALMNGNPGYVYTFTACDLSVLGTGIGNLSVLVTGPLGFLYQKSAALTSGYVSIHPH